MSLRTKATSVGLIAVVGLGIATVRMMRDSESENDAAPVRATPAARSLPASTPRRAPLPFVPPAVEDDDETDEPVTSPYVGPVHREVTEDGVVVQSQEYAPGYADRGLDGEDLTQYEAEEPEPAPSLPPSREPVNPAAYGATSLAELEARVRRQFRIPSDQRVELWTEVRGGRRGLSIQALPRGPSGNEELIEAASNGESG